MDNLFSIGEVSKIKDITIKALRYYHKVGILVPSYIDEETGYRYYSIDQFVYIDIIKGCRALGTSIAELQEIFKDCDTDRLLKFLDRKRKEAQDNIIKMKEIIKNIDVLNNSVKDSKDILNNEDIEIKYFEERKILIVPCKEAGELKELLYYSKLEKLLQDKKDKMSMERGILYAANKDGKVEPLYVFNGFKESTNLENDENISILPKGKYLTLVYSKENEEERVKKIIDYVKSKDLDIEILIELELYNDLFNTKSYSCQLQVYIGK